MTLVGVEDLTCPAPSPDVKPIEVRSFEYVKDTDMCMRYISSLLIPILSVFLKKHRLPETNYLSSVCIDMIRMFLFHHQGVFLLSKNNVERLCNTKLIMNE